MSRNLSHTEFMLERYRNLLVRSAIEMKDSPGIPEATLPEEIMQELETTAPVATTWYIGVHAAIARLMEAQDIEKQAAFFYEEEGRYDDMREAQAAAKGYAMAIAELKRYVERS